MKKKWIMIFCAATMFTGSFCFSGTALADSDEITEIGMPNPFISCETIEDAAELAGFSMKLPENPEGYSFITITAVEDSMIQIQYTTEDDDESEASENKTADSGTDSIDWDTPNQDTEEITVRKASGSEDISGDYNEYPENGTIVSDRNLTVTVKGKKGLIYTAVWARGKFTYSITAGSGIDSQTLYAMISKIR